MRSQALMDDIKECISSGDIAGVSRLLKPYGLEDYAEEVCFPVPLRERVKSDGELSSEHIKQDLARRASRTPEELERAKKLERELLRGTPVPVIPPFHWKREQEQEQEQQENEKKDFSGWLDEIAEQPGEGEKMAITIHDMLLIHNNTEEELEGELQALKLARLTMYRFPVEWYREKVEQGKGYELEKFFIGEWFHALYNSFPLTPIDEEKIRVNVEQRFLTGDEREEVSRYIESGGRKWPLFHKVYCEVMYWNMRAEACEAGLDSSFDALAAGVPLEYVFPDYCSYPAL
jgi:hypothetical protein